MRPSDPPRSYVRLYVWREGWSVQTAWRITEPDRPGMSDLTDCTDMSDDEFHAFVQPMLEDEHRMTAPGYPGDPGRF